MQKVYEAGVRAGNGTEEERGAFREMLKTYGTVNEGWQRGILALSSNSRWADATKSGHNVQFTEPELIVEELRWVLDNLQ